MDGPKDPTSSLIGNSCAMMNLKLLAVAVTLYHATPAATVAVDSPSDSEGSYSTGQGESSVGQDGNGIQSPPFPAKTYKLWDDLNYGQESNSLSNFACSGGENGLLTRGYKTIGDLPTFPFIGGIPQIQGYNSPSCGTCWGLTYTGARGTSTSYSFIAINEGSPSGGFTTSPEAMNSFTGGNADTLNGLLVAATQLPASSCKM